MPEKCLLLLDSYGGQNDDKMYDEVDSLVENYKILERLIIPPKTTPILQPLDVGFFRFCKMLAKRIANYLILEDLPINLRERNNIITMWSLIFNQFSSIKFRNMWKNEWIGLEKNSSKSCCQTIHEILFDLNDGICEICQNPAFIKCSHCDRNICFNDFFINYHYHFQPIN